MLGNRRRIYWGLYWLDVRARIAHVWRAIRIAVFHAVPALDRRPPWKRLMELADHRGMKSLLYWDNSIRLLIGGQRVAIPEDRWATHKDTRALIAEAEATAARC